MFPKSKLIPKLAKYFGIPVIKLRMPQLTSPSQLMARPKPIEQTEICECGHWFHEPDGKRKCLSMGCRCVEYKPKAK